MLVALPSAIAFGIAVFGLLGPELIARGAGAGIIGAAVLGILASLLGGAPRLISTPCAPAAAVLAAFVGQILPADPSVAEKGIILLLLVAFLAGVFQVAYGAVGAGRLIKYIPYPVVAGYLSGVGVLIFASQVSKFLGTPDAAGEWSGLFQPDAWNAASVVTGAVTIAGVMLMPRATRAIPAAVGGLACGMLAYGGFAIFDPALRLVDGNPLLVGNLGGDGITGMMTAHWAGLTSLSRGDLALVVVPALTLSVLLSIDTLKTCVVLDALTRSRHNANRELMGQGAGNCLSSLLGGMPGAGAMGPTLVNKESGGRTRLSGVLEGVFVVLAVAVFGRWIAWVPIPALAGLLIVVAIRMFDWKAFSLLRQRSTLVDFAVIAAVVVVAVTVNLIAASGTGLALAILLFIREQINGRVVRRLVTGDKLSSTQQRTPEEQAILEREGGRTSICELQGSLFFGTTDQLYTELEEDLKRCRFLVLDWRRVRSVDYTAAYLLERFEAMLGERGGSLLFTRLPGAVAHGHDLRGYFAQVGVIKDKVRVFDSLDDALVWVEEKILSENLPERRHDRMPLALSDFEVARALSECEDAAAAASCVSERSCAAGETVFRAGETTDELFLIRKGVVRIVLPLAGGGHHNLASFARGSFFGEMAFLDARARSADAIATRATELYVISRARFNEVAEAHPEVGMKVLAELARALAVRLRRSDAEIRTLYDA